MKMKNRTLVIGDIHGAYLALEQVLQNAAIRPEDKLIFLGDYVDGWSQSFEVVAYLMDLSSRNPCIFIKGNHDAWCEEWLKTHKTDPAWLFNGGALTIESYLKESKEAQKEHLEFFNRMLNYHIDEKNNLFIHAGYSSMHGPSRETYETNYRWDRTLWEMAVTMDNRINRDSKLFPKRLQLFNEIYIGHTPTLNYDVDIPMHAINVWNIDTGAAFYGKLTALDIETKEFWQSDTVKNLYPKERGRN
jgi:serine/threonine protein phosphatase 1